ncbi:MAG: sensor domain-containing diguanylate cyclase [Roseibium sp.]|uniref:diguanylate cyclase n=1 Tax=Roseibium sp. TaxID=1936156 RepID=UPI0026353F30|nr:diguanylate cyclase [Roseibium sp.]MCV0425370.1 sensor domain-containing diguanylate cyclase [Roseibium sp.]
MGANLARHLLFRLNGAWSASIVAIVCILVGAAITAHVGQLVRNEQVSQHKREAFAGLSETRARLEGELSRTVAHALGIRAYVAQFYDRPFDMADYSEIATDLLEANPSIRSIGLAPDNILRAVYPFEPNKAAIGLNYRMNASQWPAIQQSMLTREVIISGPLELVQGGRALLIRIPVFPATYPGEPMMERAYWGIATLVLDEERLMAAAGIENVVNGLRIAVVERNADDPAKSSIFGDVSVQNQDFVSLPLNLPGGLNWELEGYPQGGWSGDGRNVWLTQIIGGLISLAFGIMAFLLISEVYKVRSLALRDPLTGLANRRLLADRMQQLAAMSERSGTGFDIFYVDLDAFKAVNDTFGHAVGDQLLIEVGRRLKTQVRQSDTVARVGGDEFIVLTPGDMERDGKQVFLTRLSEKTGGVFECSGARIDVNASIGSANYPADAGSVEDLLKVADGRMYAQKDRAKQNIKNILGEDVPQAG